MASILTPAFSGSIAAISIVCCVWALDDAVEHATGWWTPLDWLWNQHIREYVVELDDE
jgi:hypothetical protein